MYSSEEEVGESASRAEHQPPTVVLPVGTNAEEQQLSEEELARRMTRTRATSTAEAPTTLVEDGKFSASKEEEEETVDHSMDGSPALMSTIPLNIPTIAFNAAKQGDSELLEILLGPSIASERDIFVELSAQKQAFEDKMRIYEFMLDMTEKRIAEVTTFDALPDEYKNYEAVSMKLNKVSDVCIRKAIESYHAEEKPFNQCVVLNDYSYRKVVLEIDQMHSGSLHELRGLSLANDATIGIFLESNGVKVVKTGQTVSFYLSDGLQKAMENLWLDRFVYRSELMVFPKVDAKSFEIKKKALDNEACLYRQYIATCRTEIQTLDRDITAYHATYIARCKRQLALIESLMGGHQSQVGPELLNLLGQVKTTILFKMGDNHYKHLANTPNEPKNCWLSPHIRNGEQSTLLHVAVQRKRYRAAHVIRTHGVMLSVKNGNGETPAQLMNYEEDELDRIIQEYSRVKESQFLQDVDNILTDYLTKGNKTLNSAVRRAFYSIFHSVQILRGRIFEEIPQYRQQLQETRQALDDFEFALLARSSATNAKKGFRNRSDLHDPILGLVNRYLDLKENYGVKRLDEEARITITSGSVSVHANELAVVRAESERNLQQVIQQAKMIERLEGENQDLSVKLDEARTFTANQSMKIASQDAIIGEQTVKINQQADELKALQSTVAQQGASMKVMKDSLEEMRSLMLMIQQQQAAQQAMPQASDPIPIVMRRVSVNPSTLYGSPPEASVTPALEKGGIPMNSLTSSD